SSVVHPPAVAELGRGKQHDDDGEDPARGSALADLELVEGTHEQEVGGGREALLRLLRLDQVDGLERLQGGDQPDDHVVEERRRDERQRYAPEALPWARAVHLGGLVQHSRYALQRRQEDEHGGAAAPYRNEHERGLGPQLV